jgi:hypothetical protein
MRKNAWVTKNSGVLLVTTIGHAFNISFIDWSGGRGG